MTILRTRFIPSNLLWLSCWLLISPTFATGHELWVEPEKFSVAEGAPVTARVYVGEKLKGVEQAFIPNFQTRFEIHQQDQKVDVESLIGNRPALNQPAPDDGLAIIVHETIDHSLTYTKWESFESFVRHKDMPGILEAHAERGLPETGFAEDYRRFAKSLVAVGNGEGEDRRVGLRTEIVAGANPYIEELSGEMPVQVWFEDTPRADAQIELFDRAPDGEVTVTLHRTDAEGRAVLPVTPGHFYLVDAVKMLPLEPEAGAVWYSLWASLTFEIPG